MFYSRQLFAIQAQDNGAVAATKGFVDEGLFIGQNDLAFPNMVLQLAELADAARREL